MTRHLRYMLVPHKAITPEAMACNSYQLLHLRNAFHIWSWQSPAMKLWFLNFIQTQYKHQLGMFYIWSRQSPGMKLWFLNFIQSQYKHQLGILLLEKKSSWIFSLISCTCWTSDVLRRSVPLKGTTSMDAWKHTQGANIISICRLCMVVLSVFIPQKFYFSLWNCSEVFWVLPFGLLSINEEQKKVPS